MKTFRGYYEGMFYYFTIGIIWDKDLLDLYNRMCINGIKFEMGSDFKDICGNDLYENDIIRIKSYLDELVFEIPVIFKDGVFQGEGSGVLEHIVGINQPERIGNIHEGILK